MLWTHRTQKWSPNPCFLPHRQHKIHSIYNLRKTLYENPSSSTPEWLPDHTKHFPTWRVPWFPWQWPGRGCFGPGSWRFSASWQSASFGLISQQAWKPTGRAGKDQGAAKSLSTVAPTAFGMWKIEAPAPIVTVALPHRTPKRIRFQTPLNPTSENEILLQLSSSSHICH